jgi:hypothetical protein
MSAISGERLLRGPAELPTRPHWEWTTVKDVELATRLPGDIQGLVTGQLGTAESRPRVLHADGRSRADPKMPHGCRSEYAAADRTDSA